MLSSDVNKVFESGDVSAVSILFFNPDLQCIIFSKLKFKAIPKCSDAISVHVYLTYMYQTTEVFLSCG